MWILHDARLSRGTLLVALYGPRHRLVREDMPPLPGLPNPTSLHSPYRRNSGTLIRQDEIGRAHV